MCDLASEFVISLRCPRCIRDRTGGEARGKVQQDSGWLVCQDCSLHYPIRDGFPVMVEAEASRPIEEG